MKLKKIIAAILLALTAAVSSGAEQEPFFSSELIFEPGSAGFVSCHGSTITELPGGDLLAAWYGGTAEKAKDVAVYAARLKKGEKSWSVPWVIHDVPGKSEGNPVLWVDSEGVLWLFYVTIIKDNWNEARMYYKKSTDEGITWSEPTVLMEHLGWMTRNKPTVLKNGWILLPIYDEKLFFSQFLISADGGGNWKLSGKITAPGGNIQPSAVQLADGTLLNGMRTGSKNGLLWWSRSDSNGRKWSKPYNNEIKNPGSATDLVTAKSGDIVLIFNDSSTDRNPLNAAVSRDGGNTWPVNRILEKDDTGSYAYPAVITASDGTIHVTYSFNRDSIKHAAFNEAWLATGGE